MIAADIAGPDATEKIGRRYALTDWTMTSDSRFVEPFEWFLDGDTPLGQAPFRRRRRLAIPDTFDELFPADESFPHRSPYLLAESKTRNPYPTGAIGHLFPHLPMVDITARIRRDSLIRWGIAPTWNAAGLGPLTPVISDARINNSHWYVYNCLLWLTPSEGANLTRILWPMTPAKIVLPTSAQEHSFITVTVFTYPRVILGPHKGSSAANPYQKEYESTLDQPVLREAGIQDTHEVEQRIHGWSTDNPLHDFEDGKMRRAAERAMEKLYRIEDSGFPAPGKQARARR